MKYLNTAVQSTPHHGHQNCSSFHTRKPCTHVSNSPLLRSPAPDSTALHCVSRNLTTWEWFSLHVGTKCSPLGTRLRNYGGKSGGGSMSQTVHPHWHLSTVHNFPSVSTKTMKDHSHRAAAKERSGGLSCSCCVSMETNHGGYWVTYLWNILGYDHRRDILLIIEVPLQRRLFSHYSRTAREAAWCGAQQSKDTQDEQGSLNRGGLSGWGIPQHPSLPCFSPQTLLPLWSLMGQAAALPSSVASLSPPPPSLPCLQHSLTLQLLHHPKPCLDSVRT